MHMIVEVDQSYIATVACCGLKFVGEAANVRDLVAIKISQMYDVSPEGISFDVRESFCGGPAHVTHGWRYVKPPALDEILTAMEASYARSVA